MRVPTLPLRHGAVLAAALLTLHVQAGLSVPSLQARHRWLLEADGVATDRNEPPPNLVAVQLGHRPDTVPALVDDAPVGGAGLRVATTLIERTHAPLGAEVTLGAVALGSDPDVRAEGSAVSLDAGPGRLYASYQRRHWGPGWFGSLILDAAAPAVAAVGWEIGGAGVDLADHPKWQIDFFAGNLRGHETPADPRLIGMRLVWRPTPSWTLGLARTMQWGGEGRDESLGSFWNALIGRDNPGDDDIDSEDEPGNQLGGFDLRYDLRWRGGGAGVYGQIVGEDEASYMPSRYLALAGFDVGGTVAGATWRLITEWTETRAGATSSRHFPGRAYRHHLYVAGYTNDGLPIGHPLGGDVRLTSLGLLIDRGALFASAALHYGTSLDRVQRFPDRQRLSGIDLGLQLEQPGGITYGVSMQQWRTGDVREHWLGVWGQYTWR